MTFGKLSFFIFRILIGTLFFLHGAQKIEFLGGSTPTSWLISVAGYMEIIIGALVVLGLFTQIAAIAGALLMFVAYVGQHATNLLSVLLNGESFAIKVLAPLAPGGGETALLFFAIFIVLALFGAGSWSLDALRGREEMCMSCCGGDCCQEEPVQKPAKKARKSKK
jgi:putative oxidoreductase